MIGRNVSAAAAAILIVGAVLALPSETRRASDARAQPGATLCRVGGEPSQPYDERPPEGHLRYGTRPIVIGCATLASGRRVELVGYRLGHRTDTSLCIDHYFPDTRVGFGCGSNRVHGGGAIDATSTAREIGVPAVVAGTARVYVARVIVRSEVRGRLRRDATAVVTVRDPDVLRHIGVARPFRRYLAEVRAGARAVTAEAQAGDGRSLGIAFFEGFRGPTREARACYTRPRIGWMRLLDAPRAERTSRLRIAATYPHGYTGAVDVSIGGRGRVHADLAPSYPRRVGGRRVVTLPVRFNRRGTTFVDATVEGLPLSERCGERPPLRTSAVRTLAVKVR